MLMARMLLTFYAKSAIAFNIDKYLFTAGWCRRFPRKIKHLHEIVGHRAIAWCRRPRAPRSSRRRDVCFCRIGHGNMTSRDMRADTFGLAPASMTPPSVIFLALHRKQRQHVEGFAAISIWYQGLAHLPYNAVKARRKERINAHAGRAARRRFLYRRIIAEICRATIILSKWRWPRRRSISTCGNERCNGWRLRRGRCSCRHHHRFPGMKNGTNSCGRICRSHNGQAHSAKRSTKLCWYRRADESALSHYTPF